jgi:hypothetical protein
LNRKEHKERKGFPYDFVADPVYPAGEKGVLRKRLHSFLPFAPLWF